MSEQLGLLDKNAFGVAVNTKIRAKYIPPLTDLANVLNEVSMFVLISAQQAVGAVEDKHVKFILENSIQITEAHF